MEGQEKSRERALSVAGQLAKRFTTLAIVKQNGGVRMANEWIFSDGSTGKFSHEDGVFVATKNHRGESLLPKPPAGVNVKRYRVKKAFAATQARITVTLYKEQWEKLLGMADEIRAFIAENADKLKLQEPR